MNKSINQIKKNMKNHYYLKFAVRAACQSVPPMEAVWIRMCL